MRPSALPLAIALFALIASLTSPVASAVSPPGGPPREDPASGILQYAEGLLAVKTPYDARDQLRGGDVGGLGGRGSGAEGGPESVPDATMALRDVALNKNSLRSSDRKRADKMLARPMADSKVCDSPGVCVHWKTSGQHRATSRWADTSVRVASSVLSKYARAGYRSPRSDGDGRLDVYLRDIAPRGLYGYCVAVPKAGPKVRRSHDTSAFCVLDNDYAKSQYPEGTPLKNLRVTAAHELFHTVQFAYDAAEDAWFMESTATWAEDQVYDDINDNRQFLRHGQLTQPVRPLDTASTPAIYANWIFFQMLGEKLKASRAGMPTIVRDAWRNADSASGGGTFSIRAIDRAVTSRGHDLTRLYAKFAAMNQHPKVAYTEGRSGQYPRAPHQSVSLTRGSTAGIWSLDHLTSRAVRVTPQDTHLLQRLAIAVRVPAGSQSFGFVTVYHKDGTRRHVPIEPNAAGRSVTSVSFASARVRSVGIVIANAGRRYACGNGKYSCQGRPLANDHVVRWRVSSL